MSKYARKVKGWYDGGQWPLEWVKDAVAKGRITRAEYKIITRKDYEEG